MTCEACRLCALLSLGTVKRPLGARQVFLSAPDATVDLDTIRGLPPQAGARLAPRLACPYVGQSLTAAADNRAQIGLDGCLTAIIVFMQNVISLVLGGGRGTRLYPLTKYRAKPAVPLAGKYRLIDIPLSNCINSGFNKMYVLTQFLSVSLHRHIRQTYRFDAFNGGFVEILAAQQMTDDAKHDWYQGTADAVRKQLRYIQQPGVDYVVILSGDQLYRMDYRDMLRTHVESKADATIAGIPVTREQAKAFGIMRIADSGRVEGFLEKPQTDKEADIVRMKPDWIDSRGIASKGRDLVASMGIYVFNRDTLVECLEKTDYLDFGKEIFPASVRA